MVYKLANVCKTSLSILYIIQCCCFLAFVKLFNSWNNTCNNHAPLLMTVIYKQDFLGFVSFKLSSGIYDHCWCRRTSKFREKIIIVWWILFIKIYYILYFASYSFNTSIKKSVNNVKSFTIKHDFPLFNCDSVACYSMIFMGLLYA